MLYGAPQWEIPQAWFLSCEIVSTYSWARGNIGKNTFPLLAPQLQEKQWWRCSMVLLSGRFPKLGFFLAQLTLYFLLLNVYHAPSNTWKLVIEMLDVKNKILCDNMVKKRMNKLFATWNYTWTIKHAWNMIECFSGKDYCCLYWDKTCMHFC